MWRPLPLPGGAQAHALAKVGARDLSRLRWLLDLLNRFREGTAQPSPREVRNFQNEAAVFCEPVGSFVDASVDARRMCDLIQEVRGFINAILSGLSYDFEIPNVTLALIPKSPIRYMGSLEAIFRLAVARLLESDGHRIRHCARPGCSTVFIRRKRALYCGPKCSQLEQFTRYVRRHAE